MHNVLNIAVSVEAVSQRTFYTFTHSPRVLSVTGSCKFGNSWLSILCFCAVGRTTGHGPWQACGQQRPVSNL